MPRFSLLTTFVAASLCALAACGDAAVVDPPSSVAVPVCGEGGVGFAVHSGVGGGGMLDIGDELRFELGRFVAVDPSCEFTITDISRDDFGVALTGRLTEEQATELGEFLPLDRFDELEPADVYAYGTSCGIGASAATRIAWGDRRVDIGCFGEPLPEQLREDLPFLISELISLMSPWARPAEGPIRYMVIGRGDAPTPTVDGANLLEWPLGTPPEVLSRVDPDDNFLGSGRPQIWEATGDDAARLRSLRNTFVARDPSYRTGVPVTGSNGQWFVVVMRDVVKFEANTRPFVPWATEGGLVIEANTPLTTSELRYRVTCDAAGNSPDAAGPLDIFSDDETRLYWKAEVAGLPPGDCQVAVDAVDPSETLACNPYSGPQPEASVFIPAGWDTSSIFRCREPK